MADAAVSFAIENVGNFLVQEAKFLSGVRDEVEEMQIELEWMQCFLKDAERRQGESHRVRNWVSQIKRAAYDAEDVIEHFALRSALRGRQGIVNRIKKYVFFTKHVKELHQVGSKIEAIKTRLTNLRTRMQIYGIKELRAGEESSSTASSWRKRQDYAHVVDHNVVGLDHKTSEIVSQLLDIKQEEDDQDHDHSVVCISGMGGLGKTTLAKQVYGDSRVRGHFEGFAWVYISQQFREKDIWESILSQFSRKSKESIQGMTNDKLTEKVCKIQKLKKCLVVLDDIWSNEAWRKLSAAFPIMEEDNKSKILLTTRNKEVAMHRVYHTGLNTLDDTNSLELLINTIRFLGDPHHPIKDNTSLVQQAQKMVQQAQEMVKQCAGLPLAITVLGGILATKHELKEWEKVGNNIKPLLNRGTGKDDGVRCVLNSSYNDLSSNLKPCFLYLSHYPEDHEIHVTSLTQRWMGEGFVECIRDGEETMEDVAEQYVNELVSRCMIQVGKRSHLGRVRTCRMHDLMRVMCISKAKEENFMQVVNIEDGNETIDSDTMRSIGNSRRLCVNSKVDNDTLPKSFSLLQREVFPQLRSLLWLDSTVDHSLFIRKFTVKNLRSVRVLVLENITSVRSNNVISKDIVNLLHLRYLSLRRCERIDSSIDNLRCLQTLDLQNCSGIKLPNSIWMMEQLRHLYLPPRSYCESRKQRVGNFRNLHTLINFPPIKFDLEQNLVKFSYVKKLMLSREVQVAAVFRSLKPVFNHLNSLTMPCFESDIEAVTMSCPNLHKLHIYNYLGECEQKVIEPKWQPNLIKVILHGLLFDASCIGKLGKLQRLKFLSLREKALIGREMICNENDFPQLQFLELEGWDDLETWKVHEGALPSLSHLNINWCRSLKRVPDRFQFLKELKEVKFLCMPYEFRIRLEAGGDDWHKVSHVPSISFIHCDQEPEPEQKADIEEEAEQHKFSYAKCYG